MKIKEKAAQFVSGVNEFSLASVNEEGYPRICIISKTKTEGIRKVWGTTGLNSVKVRHFQKNPKAGVCFRDEHNSVTLTGTVTVKTEPAIKREMWQDWFIEHYTGGVEDPNYCVLEFTAEEATIWLDGEFITVPAD